MNEFVTFVTEHAEDEITKLLLNRSRWPEIDVSAAVDCIISRRKLKGKVARWAEDPALICPLPLSAEQCSSDETAAYKAKVAAHIADVSIIGKEAGKDGWRIADLTGGLGVDSWYFSRQAEAVLYNEMQPILARAARHNFEVLEARNVKVSNLAVAPAEVATRAGLPYLSPADLLKDFHPDIIFMDPARRGEGGRKVFLLEDCTPDVLGLLDELWECTGHLLLKLSPMADISKITEQLGNRCREVHVVSSGGECKELLIWIDREWKGSYDLILYESGSIYRCPVTAEQTAVAEIAPASLLESMLEGPTEGWHLFEPGKALMKAGLFNQVSDAFGLYKLGKSTHYYLVSSSISPERQKQLEGLGKLKPIREVLGFNKRSFKDLSARFPHCEITARNLPISSDELRKKLKAGSGDDAHLYALKSDEAGNLIFVC